MYTHLHVTEGLAETCVDLSMAARYADHEVTLEEAAGIDRHIDTCARCRELISALAVAGWTGPVEGRREPPAVLPRGTMIGRFELQRPLDAGGMGLVYVAYDRELERTVAIKAVRDRRSEPSQLLHEARTMAKLSHGNVVAIYDVIAAHDQIFLAMELVAGRSVRRWLDERPRPWREVVEVFLAAGAGLAAAHAVDIVHGDVKPANLLYGDDRRVRVIDFGLSTRADGEAHAGVGTPGYMAPELRAGGPCDAAADQYAFCASLHEALFGSLPGDPPARRARVPRALRGAIARGLAAAPRDRFPAMPALLHALRATASRRLQWIAATAAAALVIGTAAFVIGGQRVEARMCELAAAKLASPWNDATRFRVRHAFALAKVSYAAGILPRVEANLDRWSEALASFRRGLCDEVGDAPLGPLEECLHDRIRDANSVINVFLDSVEPATVLNAVAATEQLVSAANCREQTLLRPAPPLSASRKALAGQLSRAFALMATGHPRDAQVINHELVAAARASGDFDAQSAALVSLGRNQIANSDYDGARASLIEAINLAERAGDDRVRVQAWANLVALEYRRGHYAQALEFEAVARGAAQRIGDRYLETELMINAGAALGQLGRAAEAQPLFEEAVEIRRKLYGETNARVAAALTALGNSYAMQGNLEAGMAAHRQATAIAEAALGPSHPDVAVNHGNLGDDHLYGLRAAEATVELEQAARIFEAAYGAGHASVAGALTDLGLALLESGRFEDALAASARAESIWAEVAPKHPARAEALLGRYLAKEALHRPAPSADLEEALALGQRLPPFERARIQLALARVTAGERGAALIADAIAGLSTSSLPLPRRELAAARAWQQARWGKP
jgi:eukaryotic-like serine/threonine-protein kinase